MFNNIKKKYINYCIQKQNRNKPRKKHYSNLKEISNIGILFSADSVSEKELQEIKYLIGEEKLIHAWGFQKHNVLLKDSVHTHLFGNKEISFFQKPLKKIESRFLSEKCDLLIDITTEEILPLKYLLGISKAPCRCGMHKKNYSLYDVEIQMPFGIREKELLQQILYYLNAIQTKL